MQCFLENCVRYVEESAGNKLISTSFAGGQKSRVAFADLALSTPDVIVLVRFSDRSLALLL